MKRFLFNIFSLRILSMFVVLLLTGCGSLGGLFEKKAPASDDKKIHTFMLLANENITLSSDIIGSVEDLTIDLTVPSGTDVSTLVPDITFNGVEVSPSDGASVDFSDGEVLYTVTAQNGSSIDYTVFVAAAPSDSKEISTFKFLASENEVLVSDVTGEVDFSRIDVTVPSGTDVSALVPDITITGTEVSPSDGEAIDFSSGSFIYTVTAADLSTKDYTVFVNIAPSDTKDISTFDFLASENEALPSDAVGTVDDYTIVVTVPHGTDISALVPDITITGTEVSPSDGETVNFSNGPVAFVVTAVDMSTKTYTVAVTVDTHIYGAWSDSIAITINADTLGLDSDINNYPLLVRLDSNNFPDIASKTKPGGADIRFVKTDDTPLSYEIEDWVDGSSGVVWVLVDCIYSSAPTTIKMYYNNSAASGESSPESVFEKSNNFQGVWHLNEIVEDGGTTATHYDATVNHNDGIQGGNNDITGVISRGQNFSGTELINVGSHSSLNIRQKITISAWVNMPLDPGEEEWYSVISKDISNMAYNIYLYGDTKTKTILGGDFLISGSRIDMWKNTSTDITNCEWKYVALTYDGKGFVFYVDGLKDGKKRKTGTIDDSSDIDVYLGGDGLDYLKGSMDEARISDTARSADWMQLNYETQRPDQYIVIF